MIFAEFKETVYQLIAWTALQDLIVSLRTAVVLDDLKLGLDPGFGSSNFGVCITELIDGMVNVLRGTSPSPIHGS